VDQYSGGKAAGKRLKERDPRARRDQSRPHHLLSGGILDGRLSEFCGITRTVCAARQEER